MFSALNSATLLGNGFTLCGAKPRVVAVGVEREASKAHFQVQQERPSGAIRDVSHGGGNGAGQRVCPEFIIQPPGPSPNKGAERASEEGRPSTFLRETLPLPHGCQSPLGPNTSQIWEAELYGDSEVL